MSRFYSKNREEPQEIYMLEFPDGSTRTGDDYTEEELEIGEYTGPYTKPNINEQFQYLSWDSEKLIYIINNYDDEHYLNYLRQFRDYELHSTDMYMIEDYPVSPKIKDNYKSYRIWLRDLPEKIEDKEYELPKTFKDFENLFSVRKSLIVKYTEEF